MSDKQRSISGQGGLVVEAGQKPVPLRLKQKLNGGVAVSVGSAAATQALRP
jgi:hypothetical protein